MTISFTVRIVQIYCTDISVFIVQIIFITKEYKAFNFKIRCHKIFEHDFCGIRHVPYLSKRGKNMIEGKQYNAIRRDIVFREKEISLKNIFVF